MNTSFYVGNLPWKCTNNDLHSLFSKYGVVVSARVERDKDTTLCRGFGYVEMGFSGSVEAMKNINKSSYQGRRIKVREVQPRGFQFRY